MTEADFSMSRLQVIDFQGTKNVKNAESSF